MPDQAYERRPPAIATREPPTANISLTLADRLNASPAATRLGTIAGSLDATIQRRANCTGPPDALKAGLEHLSGLTMDDVRVHRNSPQPAQLRAHAFAQGTEIHLAPGQENYLPHEAWHVAQQEQGRVKPIKQLRSDVAVNDDRRLEQGADMLGARAAYHRETSDVAVGAAMGSDSRTMVVQAVWVEEHDEFRWDVPVSGVQWFADGTLYWFTIVSPEGQAFVGEEGKRRTHAEWKAMGAGDLPDTHLLFEALNDLTKAEDLRWGGPTMIANNKPYGPARALPFYKWLFQDGPPPSKMNCYEVVLYAAVVANIRTKQFVKDMVELNPAEMIAGGPALARHYVGEPLSTEDEIRAEQLRRILRNPPVRGDVVILGPQGQHVALATGAVGPRGHEILELDQKTKGVVRSTIEGTCEKYKWLGYGPLPQ